MAHILRKYTSNRGSALFMVISTMTALIISCMAMYFTMISANESQYAVFGQMQATQTADSVLGIVKNSLNPYNKLNPDFQSKLFELEEGESITTDANGFMALDPNFETGKTPAEIGAYSVTITCIKKEGTLGKDLKMEFDYLVMSSFNGSRDAIHYVQSYSEEYESDPNAGDDGSGGDAELFAATGYIPNDAYIDGGYYLTSVFYDTQYTYMNTYGGSGENRIALDLRTGGDLMLGTDAMTVVHSASNDAISSADVAKIGAVTWAIRGNFYPNLNSDFGMRGGSQVLVGGNFTFDSGNNSFYVKNDGYYLGANKLEDHICVYVNGDLNYSGSDIKSNIWFFVNGKITGVGQNKQNNARLFATENADQSDLHTNLPVEEWPKDKWPDGMWPNGADGKSTAPLTYNEFLKLLDQKTSTVDYYKWDLSKETQKADTQHIDIRLNATNQPWTDNKGTTYEANARNYVIAWPGSESEKLLKSKSGNEYGVSGTSFIIDSVWTHGDNNTGQNIIIDTGENENNIMTIKLTDTTGNGEFSWFVDENYDWQTNSTSFGTCLGNINNHKRLIVLRGRGTVLLDLPKGVTYQDAGYQVSANVGWLLIEGAQITTDNGHLEFKGIDAQGKYSAKIVPYIHKTCNGVKAGETNPDLISKSCGCQFTTASGGGTCGDCGGALTQVTCSIHGAVNKYCATCHSDKKDRTDWCVNRVDKKNFADFYNTLSGTEKAWVTDKSGDIIYPNTNFMLVSCDESADMRFSQTTKNQDIVNNEFFGFIYTPYVSYYAAGGAQAGGLIKLCGGMTVGDYDIRAIHAYIGCYPDKMPNDLANLSGGGSMNGGKLSGTTKTWKIDLGGYR